MLRFDSGAQGEHKIARGFEPVITPSWHWIADPRFAWVELLDEEMAKQLTSQSALALKTIKRVLNTTYDTSLAVGLEVEGHAYEKLRDSEDYREGIEAFSAKRKPKFK